MFNSLKIQNDMKNILNLFKGIADLKGAKFIGLNTYEHERKGEKTGEIANHVINTNISVMSAKVNDLNTLNSITHKDLKGVKKSSARSIALTIYESALSEMQISAKKNLNPDLAKRSAQSQAQTDAYISLSPALKIHKETGNLHIFGMAVSKVQIQPPAEIKTVKSSDKTIAKREITRHLDLRAGKFRTFIVGNIDNVKMSGETININC